MLNRNHNVYFQGRGHWSCDNFLFQWHPCHYIRLMHLWPFCLIDISLVKWQLLIVCLFNALAAVWLALRTCVINRGGMDFYFKEGTLLLWMRCLIFIFFLNLRYKKIVYFTRLPFDIILGNFFLKNNKKKVKLRMNIALQKLIHWKFELFSWELFPGENW